ncbi:MAG: hypothetical protein V4516_14850 [Pseudomonadota bacterium]
MARVAAMLSLLMLAACGADGEPNAPGVTVGGEVGVGVALK